MTPIAHVGKEDLPIANPNQDRHSQYEIVLVTDICRQLKVLDAVENQLDVCPQDVEVDFKLLFNIVKTASCCC